MSLAPRTLPALTLLMVACAAHAGAQTAATSADWPSYDGSHEGIRYSTLDQTTPATARVTVFALPR